jgi:hypothetical protein
MDVRRTIRATTPRIVTDFRLREFGVWSWAACLKSIVKGLPATGIRPRRVGIPPGKALQAITDREARMPGAAWVAGERRPVMNALYASRVEAIPCQ